MSRAIDGFAATTRPAARRDRVEQGEPLLMTDLVPVAGPLGVQAPDAVTRLLVLRGLSYAAVSPCAGWTGGRCAIRAEADPALTDGLVNHS